ncbi:MAG: glucosaminidase domain-containing protein [Spirochaetaceae bacterium]|jgi:hypothetical protein|nr:glucosaminidase domain-containing protein [Spirochaetaceae bacterium]
MKHTKLLLFFTICSLAGLPCFADDSGSTAARFEAGADGSTYTIMGSGALNSTEMAAWLVTSNPDIDIDFARDFAALYIREAALEGVNHDVAFSQMCLETGFLRFDRIVTMDMNNFGGIGAVNAAKRGERFNSITTGVRAHIQHLKAYGSTTPLSQRLVDPGYYYVRYGSAPTVKDLSGKWAADTAYGEKLRTVIDRAHYMAGKSSQFETLTLSQ